MEQQCDEDLIPKCKEKIGNEQWQVGISAMNSGWCRQTNEPEDEQRMKREAMSKKE
jgi:hypothetical protein